MFSLKSPLQNLTMLSQEELFNKSPLTFAEDLPKLEIKNANQKTLSYVLVLKAPQIRSLETPVGKAKLLLPRKKITNTKVEELLGKNKLNLTNLQNARQKRR